MGSVFVERRERSVTPGLDRQRQPRCRRRLRQKLCGPGAVGRSVLTKQHGRPFCPIYCALYCAQHWLCSIYQNLHLWKLFFTLSYFVLFSNDPKWPSQPSIWIPQHQMSPWPPKLEGGKGEQLKTQLIVAVHAIHTPFYDCFRSFFLCVHFFALNVNHLIAKSLHPS